MVIRSPYPDLSIPEQDILTYLFDSEDALPETPLWINAARPGSYLSLRTALQWIKRLAIGLDKLGVRRGDVLMMVSPNHIFVPVAYLGAVGSARVFSGANPLYTVDGTEDLRPSCYGDCVQVSNLVAPNIGFSQNHSDGQRGQSLGFSYLYYCHRAFSMHTVPHKTFFSTPRSMLTSCEQS